MRRRRRRRSRADSRTRVSRANSSLRAREFTFVEVRVMLQPTLTAEHSQTDAKSVARIVTKITIITTIMDDDYRAGSFPVLLLLLLVQRRLLRALRPSARAREDKFGRQIV